MDELSGCLWGLISLAFQLCLWAIPIIILIRIFA